MRYWRDDGFVLSGFRGLVLLLTVGLLGAGLLGCRGHRRIHATGRFYRMDTVVDITLVVPHGASVQPTWAAVDSLLKDWEERFGQGHPRSEVRRLNEHGGGTVGVSPALARMIARALELGKELDGAFDPTILPVKNLWGFGEGAADTAVPTEERIRAALGRVDYRSVEVDTERNTITLLRDDTAIDVGGVAKGYALYRLGVLLDSLGHEDYLVAAGGDILSRGKRRDGVAWRIGIQHPRIPDSLLATVSVDGGAVVTSGDYERFRMVEGTRYHHLFDPRTGRPARRHRSMTIWGSDPVAVDILSTGLFCLTPEEVIAFVNDHHGFECVAVDSSGEVYVSEGWRDEVVLPAKSGA